MRRRALQLALAVGPCSGRRGDRHRPGVRLYPAARDAFTTPDSGSPGAFTDSHCLGSANTSPTPVKLDAYLARTRLHRREWIATNGGKRRSSRAHCRMRASFDWICGDTTVCLERRWWTRLADTADSDSGGSIRLRGTRGYQTAGYIHHWSNDQERTWGRHYIRCRTFLARYADAVTSANVHQQWSWIWGRRLSGWTPHHNLVHDPGWSAATS
jgi:hypothetical protein